jgi:hypothetical protein
MKRLCNSKFYFFPYLVKITITMDNPKESNKRDRIQKMKLLLLMDDFLEEDEDFFTEAHVVALSISQWPCRYFDLPCLHVESLLKGGLNYFESHADSQSFEKLTRLDLESFNYLYSYFEPLWKTKSIRGDFKREITARLTRRKLSGRATLVLVLHWLSHVNDLTALAMMTGVCAATISSYVRFGMLVLDEALQQVPEAVLSASKEHLTELGRLCGETYGEVMSGCCIVTDGSLHALERDAAAQWAYLDYDHDHIDYNGWKSCYCKKGLYFFSLDGCVVWYCIDCPGRWHDGLIFDNSASYLQDLPEGLWILGDSAFPRIPGKVERSRKKNECLPTDDARMKWQLDLESWCGKTRISSEWGVKDVKNVWRRFKVPLPSDDHSMRRLTWKVTLHMNNFRNRRMQLGQMRTVFYNDVVMED